MLPAPGPFRPAAQDDPDALYRQRDNLAAGTQAVTEQTFDAEVIKSPTPVLVDFWAIWCGPCKMIAPIVEDLAGEYAGKLKVMKLDVDDV